jgi:hypothetical protein
MNVLKPKWTILQPAPRVRIMGILSESWMRLAADQRPGPAERGPAGRVPAKRGSASLAFLRLRIPYPDCALAAAGAEST